MFVSTEQGKVRKVRKVQITKDYFLKIVKTIENVISIMVSYLNLQTFNRKFNCRIYITFETTNIHIHRLERKRFEI